MPGLSGLQLLPPEVELETKAVLKQLSRSHRYLAELKGYAGLLPNKDILVNAVTINESKDSSEIENIVTTHDQLYKAMAGTSQVDPAAREVVNYRRALWQGYQLVQEKRSLTIDIFKEIHKIILENDSGIRRVPGTKIINQASGEIVHTPPADYDEIVRLLDNLEEYINAAGEETDPLIKLAVIHYQFEAIHPFYDGNGRTGRIINVLYLILKELLDSPILYLSRYIIANKAEYYRLLQRVSEDNNWEAWIDYILKAVEVTARNTLKLARSINELVEEKAEELKRELANIYSRELIDVIFNEFYTRISDVQEGLEVTRKTASNYLSQLEEIGLMKSEQVGRQKIYINRELLELVKANNRQL